MKRVVSTKGPRAESIMSVQDITIQSQALLNVKDSNKVYIDALQIYVNLICLVKLSLN